MAAIRSKFVPELKKLHPNRSTSRICAVALDSLPAMRIVPVPLG